MLPLGDCRLRTVPRAGKESANSRVRAASLRGAAEVVGSKSFLSVHFCELCLCPMFSSWWLDCGRVKRFVRAKEFVLLVECGAKKSFRLEGEDEGNLFVLTRLI